ncbi:MAG: nucleotidyl transferase AbiEii/AbiGii toxin family protein [bacterium]
MFALTQNELGSMAQRTGFAHNSLEKALRMLDILATLRAHPAFHGALVLKGGTALNMFFLDMPRLSIDLDLNYIGALAAPDMKQDRQRIRQELQTTFNREYAVDLIKDVHALSQFRLTYRTLAGSSDSLRLEINYLLRQPILEPRLSKSRLDPRVEFLCLGAEEIVAGKIIALLARYTARDLFDVYKVAGAPMALDKSRLRSLVVFFGLVSRSSVFDLFKADFSPITPRRIRNDLVPMLRRGEYPDREGLVSFVADFLRPLTSLGENETSAISEFYAHGTLSLDALIPERDMRERMARSPALAWKTRSIVSHMKARG